MSTIESPEQMAERLWPLPGHDNSVSRAAGAYAIRKRDEQWRKALLAKAAEWETTAPASSEGYVAWLREFAASLGGPGR